MWFFFSSSSFDSFRKLLPFKQTQMSMNICIRTHIYTQCRAIEKKIRNRKCAEIFRKISPKLNLYAHALLRTNIVALIWLLLLLLLLWIRNGKWKKSWVCKLDYLFFNIIHAYKCNIKRLVIVVVCNVRFCINFSKKIGEMYAFHFLFNVNGIEEKFLWVLLLW